MLKNNKFIPIYKPYIDSKETNNTLDCMNSSWISSKGSYIEEFETKVGRYINSKYCLTTSNGTTALHLAMVALEIKHGDEVITSNFTYVASTNAILYVGATPIFCDINKDDLNIDPSKIEEKISKRTKAILVTNVYGFIPDYVKIQSIAKQYNLAIIEDAAESFGSTYNNEFSGTFGDISTFSFFGNKTITTGEGGMVIFKNRKHYMLVKKLKNQGNSDNKVYYHDLLGYNYRMTNIQAAIGSAQIEKIDEILIKKRWLYEFYKSMLDSFVDFPKETNNTNPSYWMTPIICRSIDDRMLIVEELTKNKIETRPFFTPIDLLPFYKESDANIIKPIYKKGILLPSFPSIKEEELNFITKKIIKILKK